MPADAPTNDPGCSHTMTGSGGPLLRCGAQMCSLRQSSMPTTAPAGLICGHTGGLATVASRVTGAQGAAGTGGTHRRSPAVDAPYGTARNSQELPRSIPLTSPCSVATRHGSAWPSTTCDHGLISPAIITVIPISATLPIHITPPFSQARAVPRPVEIREGAAPGP